jgi:F-type H+-transporting ATPase subunit gamma
MTGRLADIGDRIAGIRQLGAVVSAMRGIAAARARNAKNQLDAVEAYSTILAAAIGRALALAAIGVSSGGTRLGLIVFCAEQGFAGAFSERVLDSVGPDLASATVFLVGTRGVAVAAERGIAVAWTGAMPPRSLGIPRMADGIAEALYARIAEGKIGRLDAVFTQWQAGQTMDVQRRRLFPLDTARFAQPVGANPPLLNLIPSDLLAALTSDYVHAQLSAAGLQAFAAENQARMMAMASTHTEIDRKLARLQRRAQVIRQEEITAEIVELAAGEAASFSHPL